MRVLVIACILYKVGSNKEGLDNPLQRWYVSLLEPKQDYTGPRHYGRRAAIVPDKKPSASHKYTDLPRHNMGTLGHITILNKSGLWKITKSPRAKYRMTSCWRVKFTYYTQLLQNTWKLIFTLDLTNQNLYGVISQLYKIRIQHRISSVW